MWSNAVAQDQIMRAGPDGSQPHPVLSQIQNDYKNGQLSLDHKVLYQLYAGLKPQALPKEYQTDQKKPIKCGVPAILEYRQNKEELSAATISEIETLLQSSVQAQETYISPSGKFEIHYDTSGEDAVPPGDTEPENGIPDYVEWVAAAADSSWNHEVQNLGHADPVTGNNAPYQIYLIDLNYYGETREQGSGTYIILENDFVGFPENTDPEGDQKGAVKVTVAHELKHAIQYANSEWYGWPGNPDSPHGTDWSEMDATFMEEVVYDNVNDYYNYIGQGGSSVFITNDHSIPVAYDGVTWFIYFWEKYGDPFWPGVWTRIEERYQEQQGASNPDYLTMREAVTATLQEDYNESFETALTESHLWHFASGNYARNGYGFEENVSYPNPNFNLTLIARDSMQSSRSVNALSANYIAAFKELDLEGFLRITAEYENENTYFGVIGFFQNGSVKTLVRPGNSTGESDFTTTWDWSELEEAGIIVVNSGSSGLTDYRLTVTSHVPEEVQLAQNYPNPFNPGTTIKFALPHQSQVELKVYNVTGRKVATLRNELLPAGFYEVPFNGSNLASGVYFYQLITDQKVVVKKMTLIK